MKIKVFREEDYKTISWSGGTTTELFIYPLDSSFSSRIFKFRLSTAKVEIENSKFTPLQGISRKLMVLDGQIELIHEHHHTSQLSKFDIDEFEGAWDTQCKGTCEDFNLMTQGLTKGNIDALTIENGQVGHHNIKDNIDWLFVYAYTGKISCTIEASPTF
ncbi:MAG TPA: HutD family protein [Fulvivirga sp.]|nr:HutD family protein [Fulvivirga sp.]